MKLLTHIKLESSIVSTTLFVIGAIISAGALYEYQNSPERITMLQICMTVGLTLFMGLIAIHFTARSIRQTVVYLERKKEQEVQRESERESASELDIEKLAGVQNDPQAFIVEISRQLEAGQAALYVAADTVVNLKYSYALSHDHAGTYSCNVGEGLVGRVASSGSSLYIDKVPEGYITIFSGLGSASPRFLVLVPLVSDGETKGVLELALFKPLTENTIRQLESIGRSWAKADL